MQQATHDLLLQKNTALTNEVKIQHTTLKEIQATHDSLLQKSTALTSEVKTQQAIHDMLQQNTTTFEIEVERQQTTYDSLMQKNTALTSEVEIQHATLKKIHHLQEQQQAKHDSLQQKGTTLTSEIEMQQATLETIHHLQEQQQTTHDSLLQKNTTLTREIKIQRTTHDSLLQKNTALTSEVKMQQATQQATLQEICRLQTIYNIRKEQLQAGCNQLRAERQLIQRELEKEQRVYDLLKADCNKLQVVHQQLQNYIKTDEATNNLALLLRNIQRNTDMSVITPSYSPDPMHHNPDSNAPHPTHHTVPEPSFGLDALAIAALQARSDANRQTGNNQVKTSDPPATSRMSRPAPTRKQNQNVSLQCYAVHIGPYTAAIMTNRAITEPNRLKLVGKEDLFHNVTLVKSIERIMACILSAIIKRLVQINMIFHLTINIYYPRYSADIDIVIPPATTEKSKDTTSH
ncbi:hypothetical protein BC936DRAFT_140880 [Jimgerdemannia flammicorona]|uniref:Uncharacterized protein n=1 Tax=Jimgerdemannia flammicorona TaxID=994334 RepID=A0A433A393_9FUNG|nr:hypothetical protein BC936DRAFT_140880 [Jimgerdemannia flammicorona]